MAEQNSTKRVSIVSKETSSYDDHVVDSDDATLDDVFSDECLDDDDEHELDDEGKKARRRFKVCVVIIKRPNFSFKFFSFLLILIFFSINSKFVPQPLSVVALVKVTKILGFVHVNF